jgi:hypothetical protein
MVHRKITYDPFYEEWTCAIGGPGDPKIVCDSKDKLEQFLDYLDSRNRKRKEVAHAGTREEGEGSDRDWRGVEQD